MTVDVYALGVDAPSSAGCGARQGTSLVALLGCRQACRDDRLSTLLASRETKPNAMQREEAGKVVHVRMYKVRFMSHSRRMRILRTQRHTAVG